MITDVVRIVRAMLVGIGSSLWGWGVVALARGNPPLAFLFILAGFSPVLLERILKDLGIGEAEKG